jgi:hypothetical protein
MAATVTQPTLRRVVVLEAESGCSIGYVSPEMKKMDEGSPPTVRLRTGAMLRMTDGHALVQ